MNHDDVLGLQYDAMTALGNLADILDLVDDLADSYQRGLGFLTPDARAQLDAQVATDRHALRTQPKRDTVGLNWLNRDRDVIPSGHVRAPGNVTAISLAAEIHFVLHHHARRLLAVAEGLHDDDTPYTVSEPSTRDLIRILRTLVVLVSDPARLDALTRDATDLHQDATKLIDGDDKTLLADTCPHCEQRTLVVHWPDDLIRCGRDQATGHLRPCVCADPLCRCKTHPIAHRHTWHRSPVAAGDRRNTWAALNNLITTRRAAEGAPK